MSRYRFDIKNEDVLECWNNKTNFPTLGSIAAHFNCSKFIIKSIINGTRVKKPKQKKRKKIKKENLCTCCHFREKAPGNYFLCEHCFKKYSSEHTDEYSLNSEIRTNKI